MEKLIIKSPSFTEGGTIPKKHTGFGEDISPEFRIEGINENTQSLAIILDDLDVPFSGELCHWIIWNILKTDFIPENIEYGAQVKALSNAV